MRFSFPNDPDLPGALGGPTLAAEPQLRQALCRLWYCRSQLGRLQGRRRAQAANLAALLELLCQRLCEDWEGAYAQVAHLITHTMRASSAVECMNSVLRMHQNRHRDPLIIIINFFGQHTGHPLESRLDETPQTDNRNLLRDYRKWLKLAGGKRDGAILDDFRFEPHNPVECL